MEERKILSVSINESDQRTLDYIRNHFLNESESDFFKSFINEKSDAQLLKWFITYVHGDILTKKGA